MKKLGIDVLKTHLKEGIFDPNAHYDYSATDPTFETNIFHFLALHPRVVNDVTVGLLCEKGVDINALDFQGTSPIYSAIRTGNLEVIRIFLKNGANPHLLCNEGANSCYAAAFMVQNKVAVFEIIWQRGVILERNDMDFIPDELEFIKRSRAICSNKVMFSLVRLGYEDEPIDKTLEMFSEDLVNENIDDLSTRFKNLLTHSASREVCSRDELKGYIRDVIIRVESKYASMQLGIILKSAALDWLSDDKNYPVFKTKPMTKGNPHIKRSALLTMKLEKNKKYDIPERLINSEIEVPIIGKSDTEEGLTFSKIPMSSND